MSEDRFKEKRENRRSIFCSTNLPTGKWFVPSKTPNDPCGGLESLPTKFYAPEEGELELSDVPFPAPIVVQNQAHTVECDMDGRGPIGDPVTIAQGTYSSVFSWGEIDNLENHQIISINKISSEDWFSYFNEPLFTVGLLLGITTLTTVQAERVLEIIQEIRAELKEFANTQGVALLQCLYQNNEVSAQCPSRSVTVTDPQVGEVTLSIQGSKVTIPAGTYTSSVSQVAANLAAQNAAEDALTCEWKNDNEFSIFCLAGDGVEETLVQADANGKLFKAGDVTIGPSVLTADEFDPTDEFLEFLKAEREFELGCEYEDETAECFKPKTCSCPEGTIEYGDENYDVPIDLCDYEGYSRPNGTLFKSSDPEAVEEACDEVLYCTWSNDEVKAVCPDNKVVIYAVTIPAGTVVSDVSKEDANELAQDLANEVVECTPWPAGECGGGDCLCLNIDDYAKKFLRVSLSPPGSERREWQVDGLRRAAFPCDSSVEPVPWSCDERAREANDEEMNAACDRFEKFWEQAAIESTCEDTITDIDQVLNGELKICWQEPEPFEPGDGACPEDCECMTREAAIEQFGASATACNTANDPTQPAMPCGVAPGDSETNVPTMGQFCFKGNEGGGGGGGGGGGDGDPECGRGNDNVPCVCLNPALNGGRPPCPGKENEVCKVAPDPRPGDPNRQIAFQCFSDVNILPPRPQNPDNPDVPDVPVNDPKCGYGASGESCECLLEGSSGPPCPGKEDVICDVRSSPNNAVEGGVIVDVYKCYYRPESNEGEDEQGPNNPASGLCGTNPRTQAPCRCLNPLTTDLTGMDQCSPVPCDTDYHNTYPNSTIPTTKWCYSTGTLSDDDDPQDPTDESKDNAIVDAPWSSTGQAALHTVEAPEVLFDDVYSFPITGSVTYKHLDPRYMQVLDQLSDIKVTGATGDTGVIKGVYIEGNSIVVKTNFFTGPDNVVVRVTGTRKGFRGVRFPERTPEERRANDRRLNLENY